MPIDASGFIAVAGASTLVPWGTTFAIKSGPKNLLILSFVLLQSCFWASVLVSGLADGISIPAECMTKTTFLSDSGTASYWNWVEVSQVGGALEGTLWETRSPIAWIPCA